MPSIFNVSDEEAKRIRLLHESESENKKIDSTLITEQAQCGGQGQTPGKAVHWTNNCPGSPNLLNPFPCAMVDGQTPHSGMIGWQINVGGGHMGFCATISSISNFGGNLTSTTPTPLERSNSCTDCTTPYGTGNQTSVNCNNGNCVTVQGTGGQFATLADCQQQCSPPTNYDCIQGSCQQTPNGQYATLADCQTDCTPLPSITYNCGIQGTCVPVQGAGGQYLTLADCTEDCEYEGKWTCKKSGGDQPMAKKLDTKRSPKNLKELTEQLLQVNSGMASQIATPISGYHCVKDPNGIHNTKQACEAQCPPEERKINCINCEEGVMTQVSGPNDRGCPPGFSPVTSLSTGPCVECQQGTCVNVGWGYGQGLFNSMAECQQSPTCNPPQPYECVNGTCQQDNNGQYPDLVTCQQNCNIPNGWECDQNSGCSQVPGGQYQSQAACETACCNDIIANWGWANNNPNATANQACQRLYNQFGSSTPGPQPIFSDNCMYNYLMNIVNTGGGCGNTNFMALLEGFAGTPGSTGNNGCYGNPNSGCDTSTGAPYNPPYTNCPHQNSICGKKAFFCSNVNSYQSWWKCAWATDFAAGLVTGPGGPPYSNATYPCNC